uniref:Putative uncharacterized protein HobH n=1 Tax=Escherichia coli TaxID=562 RepID=HOBH_ECOLX|nr:PUTATIVE PSEUDOGENE: RecName: Full=Putative uncharacterized protein HobH [Escherichia coli]
MRIPTSADIACGGNIIIRIAIKNSDIFILQPLRFCILPWFIARKRSPDSCWWQEYENYPPAFLKPFLFSSGYDQSQRRSRHRAYMHINQLASDLFWNAEFIPAIVHFFPEHRIFQIIFAFWREGFFAAPEARTGKKYRVIDIKPHRHCGTALRGYFQFVRPKPNEWVPVQQAWQR